MNDWLEVHALVDGELSTEERAKLQERLKTCQVSQAEYRAVHQLKETLAAKCIEPHCEEVWHTCVKRLEEMDKTKRVESFVGRYAWGICGLFFCFILAAATFNRINGGALNTGDVERVSASLAPLSAPRSQGTDDKRRWLQDNLDSSMQVNPDQITVVGGGEGALSDGRRISRADLQDGKGRLKLYVIESADHVDGVQQVDGHSQYSVGRVNGFNSISWSDHKRVFLLSGDRPIDDLCKAADSLYSH